MDLDMGKYAVYVWGSYGASAVALIGITVLSLRAHSRKAAQLKALQDRVSGEKTTQVDA